MSDLLFWLFAALLVISALGVVLSRNLYRAAYCLAGALVTTALFYLLLTAPLLAAVLGRLCPVAAPVSVLTVPLTAVLVGASFAAWIGDGIPGLATGATAVFEVTANVLRTVLDAVGAVGLGALSAARPHPLWYPLYGLGWFALARTGRWLQSLPRIENGFTHSPPTSAELADLFTTIPSDYGQLDAIKHPIELSKTPASNDLPPMPYPQ